MLNYHPGKEMKDRAKKSLFFWNIRDFIYAGSNLCWEELLREFALCYR